MLRSTPAVLLVLLTGCLIQKGSSWTFEGPVPFDEGGFANALYQATGARMVAGNAAQMVNDAPFFEALASELKSARVSIDLVTFIWRPGDPSDGLVEVIAERSRAGVHCRVLVDDFPSSGFEQQVQPKLEGAGCLVHRMRQGLTSERNHRKIFVIDGRVAFTGGVGISDEWLTWRDSNVRVEGPVVAQLEQAFAENWVEETGTLLPASHFPALEPKGELLAAFVSSAQTDHVTAAERVTQLVIATARKRVWIGNAYFVPSGGLTALLEEKRRQGVDVRVMTPSSTTDHAEVLAVQRTHYRELRRLGVRLFEYQPVMYHSKTMVVDDALAMVGSINLDKLSQDLMDEGSLVVMDKGFVRQLERDWAEDEKNCVEVK